MAVRALDRGASQNAKIKSSDPEPVRVGPLPAIAALARAEVEDEVRGVVTDRGAGHPEGAGRVLRGQVDPDLRQMAVGVRGHRELPKLRAALRRHAARVEGKEVRDFPIAA